MTDICTHLVDPEPVPPIGTGCKECLEMGSTWVHLRACVECGHVGCCDQSPNRHATAHFHDTNHLVIRSFEPGEAWWYCYADDAFDELDGFEPLRP
ncbi:MAG: UBP-type zinc finger domain-containing protein [Acidimicrobiia bacterium]|nr:UBP-type zinc finger domain-containing protein [Acidimicrobiia bacterium]